MKKQEIRKEYLKLRIKGHTNNQCRKILLAQYGYEFNIRTPRRGTNRLNNSEWDLNDKSTRPKTITKKITSENESRVIEIKKRTGWGEDKIKDFVKLGHTSVNKILNKHNLTNPNPRRKKRIKYIRWQRKHLNYGKWMFQIRKLKINIVLL